MLKYYIDQQVLQANFMDQYNFGNHFPVTRVGTKMTFRKSSLNYDVYLNDESEYKSIVTRRSGIENSNVTQKVKNNFRDAYQGNMTNITYNSYKSDTWVPSDDIKGYVYLQSCFDLAYVDYFDNTYGRNCLKASVENYHQNKSVYGESIQQYVFENESNMVLKLLSDRVLDVDIVNSSITLFLVNLENNMLSAFRFIIENSIGGAVVATFTVDSIWIYDLENPDILILMFIIILGFSV